MIVEIQVTANLELRTERHWHQIFLRLVDVTHFL